MYDHYSRPVFRMFSAFSRGSLLAALFTGVLTFGVSGQSSTGVKSQEISETDGLPVLLKHLPDWENVKNRAVFARSVNDLRNVLGDRPVLDLIGLNGGTEAVTAAYPEGKLLIVEYTNPQASVDADGRFRERLAGVPQDPPVVYRRIGNYSVFVFDGADQAAAEALAGQVKYEKTVQWLGEDPFLISKFERYFISTTRDIFVSTVLFILVGIFGSILAGLGIGYLYFRVRAQKRAEHAAFSDAGGLTRLNLDDLSEPIRTE